MLSGRRIVLGVTGGIAAYKAVEVCRRLVDAGAHVVPVMTKGAEHFIGRTTLSALASEPVQTSLWDEASPIPHTKLGQGADLVLVVPATARLLGAYAAGLSTDLLTNTLLATRAPVIVCPAMHTEMWEHPAVQDNLATLRRRGVHVVEPDEGRLAGGDVGKGRLATPERIVAEVERVLGPRDMTGLHVVVTAGGTREPIDAVRVIANRSSGKQGYAIAAEALGRGAQVTLVSTVGTAGAGGAAIRPVETAAQMQTAVEELAPDRRRRRDGRRRRRLPSGRRCRPARSRRTPACPRSCSSPRPTSSPASARRSAAGQILVGFAAETDDLIANAECEAAPQEPRPDRRQRRRAHPASASSTTPTRSRSCAAGGEAVSVVAHRQTRHRASRAGYLSRSVRSGSPSPTRPSEQPARPIQPSSYNIIRTPPSNISDITQ